MKGEWGGGRGAAARRLASHLRDDVVGEPAQLGELVGERFEVGSHLEPLADKWRAFGWEVVEVDGHDHDALLSIFSAPRDLQTKPLCVIAHTHKGQGVSFMRDQVFWHHGVLSQSQYELAMQEIGQ